MGHPEANERWGILGGSFDPVHLGHLALAAEAIRLRNLDGILFVPSFHHPFKRDQYSASYDHRAAMIERAIAGNERLALSRIEEIEELSGYSVETVDALHEEYHDTEFTFLVGADILTSLSQWHRIEDLLVMVRFLAFSRPGAVSDQLPELFRGRVELVTANTPDISSTEIRTLLKSFSTDPKLKSLLSEPVLAYIAEQGLYR